MFCLLRNIACLAPALLLSPSVRRQKISPGHHAAVLKYTKIYLNISYVFRTRQCEKFHYTAVRIASILEVRTASLLVLLVGGNYKQSYSDGSRSGMLSTPSFRKSVSWVKRQQKGNALFGRKPKCRPR
jgi:hypothetical protein